MSPFAEMSLTSLVQPIQLILKLLYLGQSYAFLIKPTLFFFPSFFLPFHCQALKSLKLFVFLLIQFSSLFFQLYKYSCSNALNIFSPLIFSFQRIPFGSDHTLAIKRRNTILLQNIIFPFFSSSTSPTSANPQSVSYSSYSMDPSARQTCLDFLSLLTTCVSLSVCLCVCLCVCLPLPSARNQLGLKAAGLTSIPTKHIWNKKKRNSKFTTRPFFSLLCWNFVFSIDT